MCWREQLTDLSMKLFHRKRKVQEAEKNTRKKKVLDNQHANNKNKNKKKKKKKKRKLFYFGLYIMQWNTSGDAVKDEIVTFIL